VDVSHHKISIVDINGTAATITPVMPPITNIPTKLIAKSRDSLTGVSHPRANQLNILIPSVRR